MSGEVGADPVPVAQQVLGGKLVAGRDRLGVGGGTVVGPGPLGQSWRRGV